MSSLLRLLLCLLVWSRCVALPAEPDIRVQYPSEHAWLPALPTDPDSFWRRFDAAYQERSHDIFADRLHAFRLVTWSLDRGDLLAGGIPASAAAAAQGSLTKSVVYGLREAALELPPLAFLKENPNFFVELLRGTLEETVEESVAPLDPAYGRAERQWWRRLAAGDRLRYGLRPFRTDPYLFVSFRLSKDEKLPLLGHVRHYFRNWQEQRLEVATSLPLPRGFAVDAGTSYDFSEAEHEHKFVIKIFKEFKSGGIIHVGFESKQRPVLLAGLAFPW